MKKFDSELMELQNRMSQMASLAQSMVALAITAIQDRGKNVRKEVDQLETTLDQMQMDIDRDAIRMLTVYGPVATQLRYVLGVSNITMQLERIGDQVVNICESLDLMQTEIGHHVQPDLNKMAATVGEMIDAAFSAYFERDASKAEATRNQDDIVDALNAQIIKRLLSDEVLHNVLTGTEDIADALAQILIARHLERIADQAVNICKEVIFLVHGDDVRHNQV